MSVGTGHPGRPGSRLLVLPATGLGWSAIGLAAAFLPLVFAAGVVPRAAPLGLIAGLAGATAALVAVVRDGERALTVLAALAPAVVAVGFLVAELV